MIRLWALSLFLGWLKFMRLYLLKLVCELWELWECIVFRIVGVFFNLTILLDLMSTIQFNGNSANVALKTGNTTLIRQTYIPSEILYVFNSVSSWSDMHAYMIGPMLFTIWNNMPDLQLDGICRALVHLMNYLATPILITGALTFRPGFALI